MPSNDVKNKFISVKPEYSKVIKPKAHFNSKDIKKILDENEEEIIKLMDSLKEVVRRNEISKKCFKVLIFPNYEAFKREIFTALDYKMYLKYNTRYNLRYKGWVLEEIEYTQPVQTKSIKEMQEEYLAKNQVKKIESEINYLNKDLRTYKSKSYYNDTAQFKKEIVSMVYIYDNLRFMKSDGSIDILFRFRRIVGNNKSSSFQVIYTMTQTDNKTLKERSYVINESSIQNFLEENGFVKFELKPTQEYFKNYQDKKYKPFESKRKPSQTRKNTFDIDIEYNKYTIDYSEWEDDLEEHAMAVEAHNYLKDVFNVI